MSKIKINFIVDNNPLYSKKLEPSEKLPDLRSKLNLSEDLIFQTNDGFDVLKEDEKDYIVEDCLTKENKIILKKVELKEVKENKIIKNTPIKESKFLRIKNNLELYLYPTVTLTKEQEKIQLF